MAESYGAWGAIAVTLGLTVWNSIRKSSFNQGMSAVRIKQFEELQAATKKHFEDCNKRHEENAQMAVKVDSLEKNQERIEKTVNNIDGKLDRLIERI